VFRPTRDTRGLPSAFAYRAFTFCGATFQKLLLASGIPKPGPATPFRKRKGLGWSAFARHYWRNLD
jgi:hypothetical protein